MNFEGTENLDFPSPEPRPTLREELWNKYLNSARGRNAKTAFLDRLKPDHEKEARDVLAKLNLSPAFTTFFRDPKPAEISGKFLGIDPSNIAGSYRRETREIFFPDDTPAPPTIAHEVFHALDFSGIFDDEEESVIRKTRILAQSYTRDGSVNGRWRREEQDAELFEYYFRGTHSGGNRLETLKRKSLSEADEKFWKSLDGDGRVREIYEKIISGEIGERTKNLKRLPHQLREHYGGGLQ